MDEFNGVGFGHHRMSFTTAQTEAIAARGNVLVMAGAGTGKTSTLVARCIDCLTEKPRASIDEILMVTFTDAAASEMRRRIRAELEKQQSEHPSDRHWPEQLALFETAHIGTLHGFCFRLLREYFYKLGLDPQLAIMSDEESRLRANEVLEEILKAHYSGKKPEDDTVRELIQAQGKNPDAVVRALVLQLHEYMQTLRDPAEWMGGQEKQFANPEPELWREWLKAAVIEWKERWRPRLRELGQGNQKAAECLALLDKFSKIANLRECGELMDAVEAADADWPLRKKTILREPFKGFFEESKFLTSVTPSQERGDPLAQDWEWIRGQMSSLLLLAREFAEKFKESKRELGVVDYHDLEQYALQLLYEGSPRGPGRIAEEWRRKLRFVFVDEYQDINEAQDAILSALGREEGESNRFLVGDVKQSIYRFRLADPRIFQGYAREWRSGGNRTIALADNFRSREGILHFVNHLFGTLMRQEVGGIDYDETARLRFGDAENRRALSRAADESPRVEFHLRLKGGSNGEEGAEDDEDSERLKELESLAETDKEARMAGMRLMELRAGGHLIWSEQSKEFRPVDWQDMAILLRSPLHKSESYAKEFSRLGIPLLVARGGFYESMEIVDLLSLLKVLDNPLQDVPVLAVLHSPLVGMNLTELAEARLALRKGHFWFALQKHQEENRKGTGWKKADRFLKQFARWRRIARQASLSHCLETVLAESHYGEWLLSQPRGEQRHANVQRLLGLAQQFDQFKRQGLYRFLHFVEAQVEAGTEPDVPPVSAENAVSLMSIHQSKGLEFPVVVAADLGKQFNLRDLRSKLILDAEYGLCPVIKPPDTGSRYPSLAHHLAVMRNKRETLGEEARLLYVAATRARDTLILAGTLSAKEFEKRWTEQASADAERILSARSYLDWFALWSTQSAETMLPTEEGQNEWLRWKIYTDDGHLLGASAKQDVKDERDEKGSGISASELRALAGRLSWRYPHEAATREPAKTSVTAARRRIGQEDEEAAKPEFARAREWSSAAAESRGKERTGLTAEEYGTAHHTFLQYLALEKASLESGLETDAKRLEKEGILTPEEAACLDIGGVVAFWRTETGRGILRQKEHLRRELEFTARFAPEELRDDGKGSEFEKGDFVVVQGVADLALLLPKEIWLVDFKTDQMSLDQLPEKLRMYEPQLRLYGQALGRIYRRPVTRLELYFVRLRRLVSVRERPV